MSTKTMRGRVAPESGFSSHESAFGPVIENTERLYYRLIHDDILLALP